KAMSNQTSSSMSGLQEVRVVDRGRPAGTVDGHDDREADDDLGGGDDHDEEGRDLSVEVAVLARDADEREVRGVEHELDAHEHDDRVAPHEDADGTDREQHRRQGQVFVHCSSSTCRVTCSTASGVVSTTWPRARTLSWTDSSTGVPSGSNAGV